VYLTHLSLTNFRNYSRLELALNPGPTLFYGGNAQGKTNLLEAIYYLATTRSPYAGQEQQLLNWDALRPDEPLVVGKVIAQLESGRDRQHVEMRLIKEQQRGRNGFRRQALVNRRKVRLMDLLGNLRVVMFIPEDVQIITGSPAVRRRYLDITLCQTDRTYCRTLSDYNKVLEQRNALLRQIAESGRGLDVLPVYTQKLIQLGSHIFARRADFVAALAREARQIHYEQLTEGQETLRLQYLPRLQANGINRANEAGLNETIEIGEWLAGEADSKLDHRPLDENRLKKIEERFMALLDELQPVEIASGTTRAGPHRDDWRFWVSGRSLSSYGSRGQQRTAILALKLAEIRWMTGQTGESPILLLDEVVAELDERRRALLLETVQQVGQALLTATDPGMFTTEFLNLATTMQVSEGQVQLDNQQAAGS
jgi:DNA replication and repair protein RecF